MSLPEISTHGTQCLHSRVSSYPTFIDAVRDIDDALCMIFLFASLPSNPRVSPALIENCSRLATEWQLYIIHTHALRKTFFSIKGVYYQAEVVDQTVTWLVPYQFTLSVSADIQYNSSQLLTSFQIPTDVDVRVMLTFLELYQTLLGFVLFKLYTDVGFVYPPPLDSKKEEGAAGVGAYSLHSISISSHHSLVKTKEVEVDGNRVTNKTVKQTIQAITATGLTELDNENKVENKEDQRKADIEEEFVSQISRQNPEEVTSLPTLQTLARLPQASSSTLFRPYTFFLSRETPRSIFEFLVRSFGGRIGWPASSGSGSPVDESDESITHVIIDRPLNEQMIENPIERELRRRRKYVQPQWVADCINAGKILLEDHYFQGAALPPHLSPFGERDGAYDPSAALTDQGEAMADDEELENEASDAAEDTHGVDQNSELIERSDNAILRQLDVVSDDPVALRSAELAAEAAGVDYGDFEQELRTATKKQASSLAQPERIESEKDMNKMLMSNKQRKLYERMKYGEKKRAEERQTLEKKRTRLNKEKRRHNS